jgi:hypothetical protein
VKQGRLLLGQFDTEDKDITLLRNICNYLPTDTASQYRKLEIYSNTTARARGLAITLPVENLLS